MSGWQIDSSADRLSSESAIQIRNLQSDTCTGECLLSQLAEVLKLPLAAVLGLGGRVEGVAHFLQRGFDVPRPVQEDLFVAVAQVLLAHELERVVQRLNGRFDGDLDVLAFELQAVDLALDVLEPRLG